MSLKAVLKDKETSRTCKQFVSWPMFMIWLTEATRRRGIVYLEKIQSDQAKTDSDREARNEPERLETETR